jgi:hypothetical protein
MVLPNFLIIGAPRSGTTYLYRCLKQHPQIFLPELKEPTFFSYDASNPKIVELYPKLKKAFGHDLITSMDAYKNLFRNVQDEKAIGEASVVYLCYPDTYKNIFNTLPNVKLIVSLRNPVDAFYSILNWAYMFEIIDTPLYKLSNREELESVKQDIDKYFFNPYYYYIYLKNYFELFDPQQIKILFFEEWTKNVLPAIKDIFFFLEVEDSFQPDTEVDKWQSDIVKTDKFKYFFKRLFRKASVLVNPVSPNLSRVLSKIAFRKFVKPPPPLSPNIRSSIFEMYREDINQLQELLQKDLSFWKN